MKILCDPFAGVACPVCGKKNIVDPGANSGPMLPPTGKDYDYASQRVYSVICTSCNTKFELKGKIEKVNRAPDWDVEYFNSYPYNKRIEKIAVEQLIIPE